AAGLDLHVTEVLRIEVARVRIEPVEHAIDGAFDQLRIVRLLDVVRTHAFEDVAEQIELPVGVGSRGPRTRSNPRWRLGDQDREPGTDGRPNENQRRLAHHPRTFSLSFVAHRRDEPCRYRAVPARNCSPNRPQNREKKTAATSPPHPPPRATGSSGKKIGPPRAGIRPVPTRE